VEAGGKDGRLKGEAPFRENGCCADCLESIARVWSLPETIVCVPERVYAQSGRPWPMLLETATTAASGKTKTRLRWCVAMLS
jgi:hypothetical protein